MTYALIYIATSITITAILAVWFGMNREKQDET